MFYPSFIEKSNQDKLKITILEFSSRFKNGQLLPDLDKPVQTQKGRSASKNYQEAKK